MFYVFLLAALIAGAAMLTFALLLLASLVAISYWDPDEPSLPAPVLARHPREAPPGWHWDGRGAVLRFAVLLALIASFLIPYQATAQNTSNADSGGAVACPTLDRGDARHRADAAFRAAQFRLAGSCYVVAGDLARANLAFLRATAADSAASKRALALNAAQAKAQLAQWRQAFRKIWK